MTKQSPNEFFREFDSRTGAKKPKIANPVASNTQAAQSRNILEIFRDLPKKQRFYFSVGLFCFSLAGLFVADKLEELYPPPETEKQPFKPIDITKIPKEIVDRETRELEQLEFKST